MWGWLSREVYESGKHYSTKLELIDEIKEAWSSISLQYIEKLYESLPSRICEVLENGGGTTHY